MGIEKTASQDEIKRAYRKLARKYHPDVSKENNAEEQFKELGEAYEVLKDPKKRTAYDQLANNWQAGQSGFQPPPDWNAGSEFNENPNVAGGTADFSDFFSSLFGQQAGGFNASSNSAHTQGEDSHTKIFINLEDSYFGATRSISLRINSLNQEGHPEINKRSLNVKIPRGIKAGQNIRLQGQGSPSIAGGKAGDLYLKIEFNPHSIYKVKGLDVSLELPISPWEAMLGAKVKIPTPTGKVDLTIPPATSSGKRMRLKGLGIPAKIAGNFYVTFEIVVPDKISAKEIELYQALQQEANRFNPRAKMGV